MPKCPVLNVTEKIQVFLYNVYFETDHPQSRETDMHWASRHTLSVLILAPSGQ